jgi:hypothetical protein
MRYVFAGFASRMISLFYRTTRLTVDNPAIQLIQFA